MKKIKRNPERYATIEIYMSLGQKEGYKLFSEKHNDHFINQIGLEFKAAKSSQTLIHGIRTQAMFEYVVASLDNVRLLKSEDSGSVHVERVDIAIPDFRIIDKKNCEYLVEVKNFRQRDPVNPYVLTEEYVDKLNRYAGICRLETKLAVYWSKWNKWTLVSLDRLMLNEGKYILTLGDACMFNEMHLLGDASIGTIPPLSFRIVADKSKPNIIGDDGKANFTIGEVQLICGDTVISDENERAIAFSLMMFGDWEVKDAVAEVDDNVLQYFTYEAVPHERTPDQNFEMMGELSCMISRQFRWLTAPGGEVEMLGTKKDESFLGKLIPKDYKGGDLPIWRFTLLPKSDTVQ